MRNVHHAKDLFRDFKDTLDRARLDAPELAERINYAKCQDRATHRHDRQDAFSVVGVKAVDLRLEGRAKPIDVGTNFLDLHRVAQGIVLDPRVTRVRGRRVARKPGRLHDDAQIWIVRQAQCREVTDAFVREPFRMRTHRQNIHLAGLKSGFRRLVVYDYAPTAQLPMLQNTDLEFRMKPLCSTHIQKHHLVKYRLNEGRLFCQLPTALKIPKFHLFVTQHQLYLQTLLGHLHNELL